MGIKNSCFPHCHCLGCCYTALLVCEPSRPYNNVTLHHTLWEATCLLSQSKALKHRSSHLQSDFTLRDLNSSQVQTNQKLTITSVPAEVTYSVLRTTLSNGFGLKSQSWVFTGRQQCPGAAEALILLENSVTSTKFSD